MGNATKILVTGDYGFDYDIYLPMDDNNPPPGTPPAQIGVSVGGTGIALRGLKATAARLAESAKADPGSPTFEVGFSGGKGGVTSPPTAGLWQKLRFGKLGKTPDDDNSEVWRIRRSLNLGAVTGSPPLPRAELPETARADFIPDVVLVEDNVGGFRFQIPDCLQEVVEVDAADHRNGLALGLFHQTIWPSKANNCRRH
ncbi:MAG TPA: hypothetical protein PKM57_01440 [Kiritimatiellia bacterium]|nr:hypothetical protein [Kiritimatiellia bacterium]HPS07101.1 hypothetical protein [Kiritimatiellia bacterium]